MADEPDVITAAREIVAIAEVAALLESAGQTGLPFTDAELSYARSKSDPARRLAARLAAKRAACRVLGQDLHPGEIEVLPARGAPPRLRLSGRAEARLAACGAAGILVSLTHGQTHAAAAVVLVRQSE